MKKLMGATLGIATALLLVSGAVAQVKKYDIKSGIVTLENTINMGGKAITKHKQIVYFDEYGMKECKEDYDERDRLVTSFFSDGKDLYKVVWAGKTAYKSGKAYRGTEMKVDWNEVSDRDKKSGKAKKLANTKIAGKDCESYEYIDRGTTTKFAGWKGICLHTELVSGGMTTKTTAIRVEENAKVPAAKFQVPPGYAVK